MKRRLFALLLLPLLAGCATVSHGPAQKIGVASDPPGAVVKTQRCGANEVTFKTPGEFWASRRATDCTVTITADGYMPFEMKLKRSVSNEVDGNFTEIEGSDDLTKPADVAFGFVFTTIFGLAATGVDWATGGMYQLAPSAIAVRLSPVQEAPDVGDVPASPEEKGSP